MAYALECKNLFTMNVEFYTGVDSRLDVPVVLPPILDAADLDNLDVLIVDDVADTGKTLELVQEFCADHVSQARTAVLYHKPRSIIRPDYSWRQTELWIDFPWSAEPPVTATSDRRPNPSDQES
jgi:hypoxanthine phosphoribosyltransferase